MSYDEKGTWVYLVTSAGAYVVYLVIVLGRVLQFVLWAVAGSAIKLVAYRRGL